MRICWLWAALFSAAGLSLNSSDLNASRALVFCNFENSRNPCAAAPQPKSSTSANGFRIAAGSERIKINGGLSMQRGTVAFWFKLNALSPAGTRPTPVFTTFPGTPLINASVSAPNTITIPLMTPGTPTVLTFPKHNIQNDALVEITGGSGLWSGVNGEWRVHRIDADTFSIPVDSSAFGRYRDNCTLLRAGSVAFDASPGGSFKTDQFFIKPDRWHHIVWTWTIDRHRIYRDGRLVKSYDADSPFPYVAAFQGLTLGNGESGIQGLTLRSFGTYNFAFTDREVQASYASPDTAAPQQELEKHAMTATAAWGPGEHKVKVSIDAGNDYLGRITRFDAVVLRDGHPVAKKTFPILHQGYVEGLIDIPDFSSGTYMVSATGSGPAGVLIHADSETWPFEKPAWLGNTYGIDDTVPAPYWDPIRAAGPDFDVVFRHYRFSGGFGLPVQMTSLGQKLLQRPVSLEIRAGNRALPLRTESLLTTAVKPNEANWTGKASTNGIAITTTGKLEYDGMLLITLRLEPTKGDVPVDSIQLDTTLESDASEYLFAIKDQPFWWYTWSIRPPRAIGEFNNNLTDHPRREHTNNIFSTVFSNDDTGLEIFHNNMAGWQIDRTKPWQRFIRNKDGSVTYRCDLANRPFVLHEPIEITVGWMATPVKRLPAQWRLTAGGGGGASAAPGSPFEYAYDFSLGNTWLTFHLLPTDLTRFKNTNTRNARTRNRKELPFVNAHVLLATAPATYDELATIERETLSNRWDSSPTRGMADYWAWAMHRLISEDAADGYYIDESYDFLTNSSLLSRAGYIEADGTHGYGLNLLAAREIYKRLAKILMESGKPPNLWFHTTGTMYPHMWSHALLTLDGERSGNGYYVKTDVLAGDHFAAWNDNNSLLDPAQPSRFGTWLLGISAARKFGFVPVMWRGLQCCERQPYFELKQRKAECLYQMHDILQADQRQNWWQTKFAFGIGEPDVVFHGYQSQKAFSASDPNLKVTYYQRPHSVLAYLGNFGPSEYEGTVNIQTSAFGSAPAAITAKDAETGSPVPLTEGALTIEVPSHDCRVVQLDTH